MDLRELAVRQLCDYDLHRPGTVFAEPGFKLSIQQSYDLQFRVAQLREARGERIAGYKIGCISRTMRQQLGLDRPVFGIVWESELHSSGTKLRASDFDNLAIEGEFAVRLAADVPSVRWLQKHPEVIATGTVVIELHNYVFRGSDAHRAAELVANNAIHAGVVLPSAERPIVDGDDLKESGLTVTRGEEVLGTAAWGQLEGGRLAGIMALIEHLEQRGCRLRRGDLVLTGSPLPLWRVSAGDTIKVLSEHFGAVGCSVEV